MKIHPTFILLAVLVPLLVVCQPDHVCYDDPDSQACLDYCEENPTDSSYCMGCEHPDSMISCAVDCDEFPNDPECLDCEATPEHPSCPDPECEEEPCEESAYRFVLIEDLTRQVSGEYPGADIDAIGLIRADEETFATAVESANISAEGNSASIAQGLLGAPDFDCADGADIDPMAFTSLGGKEAGGYAIVSFGTLEEDWTIRNGDTLKVYEVGKACNTRYDDDDFQLSISTGNDLNTFTEQGRLGMGSGQAEIEVTGIE
jgi:hypothetical protein